MAKIDLPKRSGKWSKVREKSVKSQGILKTILSGNPENTLHVFCFCKVVLQEQKHVQDYLVLTENIYPRRSEIGCYFPVFATTDHFLNERPCQTYKRKLKTL